MFYVTLMDIYFKGILTSLIFPIEDSKNNDHRDQEVFDVSLKNIISSNLKTFTKCYRKMFLSLNCITIVPKYLSIKCKYT